jgi:hypothetical protein
VPENGPPVNLGEDVTDPELLEVEAEDIELPEMLTPVLPLIGFVGTEIEEMADKVDDCDFPEACDENVPDEELSLAVLVGPSRKAAQCRASADTVTAGNSEVFVANNTSTVFGMLGNVIVARYPLRHDSDACHPEVVQFNGFVADVVIINCQ